MYFRVKIERGAVLHMHRAVQQGGCNIMPTALKRKVTRLQSCMLFTTMLRTTDEQRHLHTPVCITASKACRFPKEAVAPHVWKNAHAGNSVLCPRMSPPPKIAVVPPMPVIHMALICIFGRQSLRFFGIATPVKNEGSGNHSSRILGYF